MDPPMFRLECIDCDTAYVLSEKKEDGRYTPGIYDEYENRRKVRIEVSRIQDVRERTW